MPTDTDLQNLIAEFRAVWLDDSKQAEAIRLAHEIDEVKAALYGPSR